MKKIYFIVLLLITVTVNVSASIDRTNWSITASLHAENASLMIDGNLNTFWTTEAMMTAGQWVEIDMKEQQTFNQIVIEQGPKGGDYIRGYAVYVTNNRSDWGNPVVTGTGTQGRTGFNGNDFPTVKNVTFVNSYWGAASSRDNPGGAPNAFGIYGSPLKTGIEIDRIGEVGRIEGVDFSPEYWIGSGLPGSPSANNTSYKNRIYESGTAILMRRNDWTLSGDVNVEGYNTSFHAYRAWL
ncbi:hypothetical protein FACS189421_02140 [Bacteroidia bacterium]|nr:hypothetical protein FACS189421_02140 [Bacteroidia bacterium]GHT49463.1 hypothetical protein FACS189440_15280 [Bacteroidia bacterium]